MSKFQKMPNGRFLLTMVFVITMSLLVANCGNKNVEKAEEFMKAGMFVQASALLEKEIMDSPTNAKAHFLFGMCNLSLGNLGEAEISFKRAIQLKPELGIEIGKDLLKLGKNIPVQDKSKTFQTLSMAISYDPSLKNEAARYYADLATRAQSIKETIELLRTAMSFDSDIRSSASSLLMEKAGIAAKAGKLEESYAAIAVATSLDPSLKNEAARYYADLATRAQSIKETIELLRTAMSFDSDIRSSASSLLMEKAGIAAKAGKLEESYAAIAVATSLDPNNRKPGLNILVDAFAKNGWDMSIGSAKKVIHSILSLDRSAGHSVGAVLVEFAKDDLKSGKVDRSVQWIEYMLKENLTLGIDKKEIRLLLITASNKTIENKTKFIDTMKTLVSNFPDIHQSNSSKEMYLYGAYLWMSNNKSRALEFLRKVPDEKGQLGINFVNTHIPSGRYPVELNKKGDLGWGTFTFTLESIEINRDLSMTIQIRVLNHTNKKQHFIFARTNSERFYIIDDFGNKTFAAPPHCVNTPNRKRFNSSNDAVVMEPKQEIIEQLNFAPTPKGNTGIIFISPKHNGHQWEIKFEDIKLRHVKFHPWNTN